MRRKWKQNGVLITMLVLVGTAVYLNWRYTNEAVEETGTKILGEATLVSGESSALSSAEHVNETVVYTGGDYFSSARLTRQQARDTALELLEEAWNNYQVYLNDEINFIDEEPMLNYSLKKEE